MFLPPAPSLLCLRATHQAGTGMISPLLQSCLLRRGSSVGTALPFGLRMVGGHDSVRARDAAHHHAPGLYSILHFRRHLQHSTAGELPTTGQTRAGTAAVARPASLSLPSSWVPTSSFYRYNTFFFRTFTPFTATQHSSTTRVPRALVPGTNASMRLSWCPSAVDGCTAALLDRSWLAFITGIAS